MPQSQTLFAAQPTPAPLDRHWFVPDSEGYFCAACGLPRKNRRHTPKERRA